MWSSIDDGEPDIGLTELREDILDSAKSEDPDVGFKSFSFS
jgi:hypothetical protein